MIGRIIWWLTLLLVAAVCINVQLDRQARKDSQYTSYVFEPFRSSAQRPFATFAINSEVPEFALTEARKLVQRRPLPAEHLRLLAQAQLMADDAEAGAVTIQYAGQRGWRDPIVQQAMVEIALEVGDGPQAARRFAALFMIRNADETLLTQLGIRVLGEPGSEERAELATIVGGADRWHATFLQRGARVMPPDAFAEIVEITSAQGVQFDCRRLEQAGRTVSAKDAAVGARLNARIEQQC